MTDNRTGLTGDETVMPPSALLLASLLQERSMGDFRRLKAWQKAHAYGLAVHAAFKNVRTKVSPGLRAQILRAVSSIADTLAEGCAKRSRRELAHYADMAYREVLASRQHLLVG
jgi:hypothetical protein